MPRSTPRPRLKRSYHHGDLKAALQLAALRLVQAHGPKGFTLAEAAKLTGVSPPAVYRHYADRDSLLAAVATEGHRRLAAGLRAAAAGAASPAEGLIELGVAYVRFAAEEPERFAVMFGADLDKTRHPELDSASKEALGSLLDAIERAQHANALPVGPRECFAVPAWGMAHGIASLWKDLVATGLGADPEQTARLALEGLLRGFQRPPVKAGNSSKRR